MITNDTSTNLMSFKCKCLILAKLPFSVHFFLHMMQGSAAHLHDMT